VAINALPLHLGGNRLLRCLVLLILESSRSLATATFFQPSILFLTQTVAVTEYWKGISTILGCLKNAWYGAGYCLTRQSQSLFPHEM
jgi:hypothetical protein